MENRCDNCEDINLSDKDNNLGENIDELKIEIQCTVPIVRSNFKDNVKFIKLNWYNLIIIIEGDIHEKEEVLFRLHPGCITGDIFNSERCDCGQQLDYFFEILSQTENVLLLYAQNDEGRGIGIYNKLKAYNLIETNYIDTFEANRKLNLKEDNRDFSYINNILEFFNIKTVNIITNNNDKIDNIDNKYINKIINTPYSLEPHNFNYLRTKQNNKNHALKLKNYSYLSNLDN